MSSSCYSEKLVNCALQLHKIGVVKFGNFTLKSGMQSPIYFDLRIIVSYPLILKTVCELLIEALPNKKYDHVCGVAYTGIPMATVIGQMQGISMLVKRKESKSYGTKKLVEGVFKAGDSCIIIEDILVSGSSVYDTVKTLRDLKLDVSDAVVFLDREQGGLSNLAKQNINLVSVLTLTMMMDILQIHGSVEVSTVKAVQHFIASHNVTSINANGTKLSEKCVLDARQSQSFGTRAASCSHPLTANLLAIMEKKQTNLCVAADVSNTLELLNLARQVGPHICVLKTHVDALPDFNDSAADELVQLAAELDFLLFEDRKFVDIGSTVSRQYKRISSWAHIVTAAPVLGGKGVIEGLVHGAGDHSERGVFLLAEMSSEGALRSKEYTESCLKMAQELSHIVIGFVCQSHLTPDPSLLQLTPGVSLEDSGDSFGQRYVTPEVAVLQRGADIIIVGRGILRASDQAAAARFYRNNAFQAYLRRISQ